MNVRKMLKLQLGLLVLGATLSFASPRAPQQGFPHDDLNATLAMEGTAGVIPITGRDLAREAIRLIALAGEVEYQSCGGAYAE